MAYKVRTEKKDNRLKKAERKQAAKKLRRAIDKELCGGTDQ